MNFMSKNLLQLVPLIYGTDLLERIRDNYIIIEVNSRQKQRIDNLLGIAKLPVHELYIAYKDPLILPVHLSSKVIIVIYLIFLYFLIGYMYNICSLFHRIL